ncbi:MAG: hypothetical protein NW241_17925 [Bacteroidia bacterium]|nr:hypothetical protein [Bacteroidia bacterium]
MNRKALYPMQEHERQLQDLSAIRQMVEESSRFLSLSGLSGVAAGTAALAGAAIAYRYLRSEGLYGLMAAGYFPLEPAQLWVLVLLALAILAVALLGAAWFTLRNARNRGRPLWTPAARRVLVHLSVPLLTGALFCIQLAWYGFAVLVPAATLVFYGIALLSAGIYTHREIRYLGITEIVLGLLTGCWPGSGLISWALGFGLFHIVYGWVMYMRYEREGHSQQAQ